MRLLAFAALLTACGAAGHERRHDELMAELGRAGPARDRSRVPADDPFAAAASLDRAALVRAVLERNPDIEASRLSWRAALAAVPQASALEDPMLTYELAPLSIAGPHPFGQRVELSQRLPWPGKRRLAGEVAIAEAEAARGQFETVRLELALMASNLYDDYYLSARAIDVNQHHVELIAQFKKSAEAQYTAGRASQQDPLQAEVETAHLEHDRVVLEAEREAVAAQLNGLLHRPPRARLPQPVAELPLSGETAAPLAPVAELEERALANRPELRAQAARIRGGEAAVARSRREYYPDVELMGSYDSMWDIAEHRWMIGIGLNIPLQRGGRRAAVDEAEAQSARVRRDDETLRDRIRVEVERAHIQLREAHHILHLMQDRLLPAARDQVSAALAGFVAGRNSFLAVIEAEKNLRDVELQLHTARADIERRRAALDRAVGIPAGLSGGEMP